MLEAEHLNGILAGHRWGKMQTSRSAGVQRFRATRRFFLAGEVLLVLTDLYGWVLYVPPFSMHPDRHVRLGELVAVASPYMLV